MTTNPTPDYTATVAERTIVVRWPDNARLGATPPPDGWQERAWDEPTLHEIDEGSVSGCSVLRWRDDPRPDNVLLAVSLALVTGKPQSAVVAVAAPPTGQTAEEQLGAQLDEAAETIANLTVQNRKLEAELRRLADEAQQQQPETQTAPDVVAAIVDALQAKAGELQELAEEQMRPSLEERAQEWLEAAEVARRASAVSAVPPQPEETS